VILHLKSDHIMTITNVGLFLIIGVMAGLMVVMRMPNQQLLFAAGYTAAGFIAIGWD
jgi:hypothetical protein